MKNVETFGFMLKKKKQPVSCFNVWYIDLYKYHMKVFVICVIQIQDFFNSFCFNNR